MKLTGKQNGEAPIRTKGVFGWAFELAFAFAKAKS